MTQFALSGHCQRIANHSLSIDRPSPTARAAIALVVALGAATACTNFVAQESNPDATSPSASEAGQVDDTGQSRLADTRAPDDASDDVVATLDSEQADGAAEGEIADVSVPPTVDAMNENGGATSDAGTALPDGAICPNGELGCAGQTPETCFNGQWVYADAPCSGATPICINGVCGACSPNATRCVAGNAVETCDPSGTWQDAGACPGPTPTCRNGACTCMSTICGASCVDTTSDNNNCGGCSVSCAGICANGQCSPLPDGSTCLSAPCAMLDVQMEQPMSSANVISINLNITNTSASAADLSNVKVHYYFTADGDAALTFNCDYAGYYKNAMLGFNSSNVSGTFVTMGAASTMYADTYLELSFSSAPLAPAATAEVNFRIHDSGYNVAYNQANDWSHMSTISATTYYDADFVTAYLNGTLAWGIEP